MPVTFRPAEHCARSVWSGSLKTAQSFVEKACPENTEGRGQRLQSFLGGSTAAQTSVRFTNAAKGLVSTIMDAHNNHHALVLRPDDIWLAILNQFHLYVNAHAEDLRESFVAHEGKKTLTIAFPGDFGAMAQLFTKEIDKHVVDPVLRDWILPRFSTTTPNDTVVASVLMMATLKAYFEYSSFIACGIPRVTLEGEKGDWEELLRRAEKLSEYGDEPTRWHALLRPVLSRFVRAFDEPDSEENIDFWLKVVKYNSMSGGDTLSGWITAFCAFNPEGRWLGLKPDDARSTLLDPASPLQQPSEGSRVPRSGRLILDNAVYHPVSTSKIADGHADVDVILVDDLNVTKTTMVAGIVASRVSSSDDETFSKTGKDDIIAPQPGWWIFEKK
ncbi:hypothetical protein K488DRAFT_81197 [Vararia minispora EC-137]|uniref:Uncharacterized protein n=1 Tax=Vararia minispora EC-137 TaxID=1314806 RepID=A0ACB8Q653_9AGAM|nr:hypothetical protein K488DRAFT_81197 [Vararia minispora EC-137]